MNQTVLVHTDVNERSERGDVGHDAFERHARLQVFELGHVVAELRRLELRTRIARQITLVRQRHKLALELQVIDDGPGVAEDIRDKIFNPLVSGREGGSGLGLSLAQTFIQYHQGVIECESRPGRTLFRILLPLG